MIIAFRIFAITVALLSIAIHVATFFPFVPVSMSWAWPLHLAAMAAFGLMMVTLTKGTKPDSDSARGLYSVWNQNHFPRQQFEKNLWKHVSFKGRTLCLVVGAYALLNFGCFLWATGGETLKSNGIHYYLTNHGEKIRDLTPQEYKQRDALEVRGFSGHWICFAVISAVFLTSVPSSVQNESGHQAD